jgi:hypothetical protein
MCREEFDEFAEKAKTSDLEELIMPILWVPAYPETAEEQRIFDAAKARQWVDWTQIRKLDEKSPEYRGLIDEMGERLANAARKVATKPEVFDTSDAEPTAADESGGGPQGTPSQIEEPPGLVDLAAESADRSAAISTHLQGAFAALGRMRTEVSIEPLHPGASPGQRLFFFKRVAKEISPYAEEFERNAKQAEEAARLMNKTIFNMIALLADPRIRTMNDWDETVDQLRQVPAQVQEQLGAIDSARSQVSTLGRLSRDLRVPFSAIERGFDSVDAILQLVEDWTMALQRLAE